MNWDALSAIAELLGAFAVLITLVYLAIQVKQNSELAKVQINQSGQEAFSRYRQLCLQNPEVVWKTHTNAELTDVEHIVAQNILSEALFAAATLFDTCKITAPERCDSFIGVTIEILRRHNWDWRSSSQILTRAGYVEFCELITQRLEGTGGDA